MSISGISSNNLLYNLYQSYSKPADSSSGSQSNSFGLTTSESGDSGSSAIGVDLSMLLKALDSGNLSTFQTLFSQLQQDIQAASSTDDTGVSISSGSANSNPLASDMSDLGDAIASGDLTGAQNILSNIMQHMQGPPPPPPEDGNSTNTDSVTSATSTGSSSSLSSNLSSLAEALSSGDQTSAQNYFSKLLECLQSTASTDGSGNSTASIPGTSSTTSSEYSLPLQNFLQVLASLTGTNAQTAMTNTVV